MPYYKSGGPFQISNGFHCGPTEPAILRAVQDIHRHRQFRDEEEPKYVSSALQQGAHAAAGGAVGAASDRAEGADGVAAGVHGLPQHVPREAGVACIGGAEADEGQQPRGGCGRADHPIRSAAGGVDEQLLPDGRVEAVRHVFHLEEGEERGGLHGVLQVGVPSDGLRVSCVLMRRRGRYGKRRG